MQFQWPTSMIAQYKRTVPNIARLASSKSNNRSYTELEELPLRYLKQVHTFVLRTRTFPDPPPRILFHSQTFSSSDRIAYFCYILKNLEDFNVSLDICNAVLREISSSSSSRNGRDSIQAVVLVREMASSGYSPDKYTVPFALKACAQSRAIKEGLQLQAYSVKTGLFSSNLYVRNTMLRLYAVCGFVESARQLFDESPERDLITWTTLIQCYVKQGLARESVDAFFQMLEAKIDPDEKTLVVVLSACAKLGDLELGKRIHEQAIRMGPTRDVFVGNALVDMYLKCGDAESGWSAFDSIADRNLVSWNSLISGLAHHGLGEASLSAFQAMQTEDGLEPDSMTLVAALSSCASLGLLETGLWVHAYAEKRRIEADGILGNALIDMYAKCGSLERAASVFESMRRRDAYSYSALIAGLALHGEGRRALSVFAEMGRARVRPDEVTFVGLLAGCSHAGLVSEGKRLFEEMSSLYGIEPRIEHYGCMVDLLGRAGRVEEALELVRAMPMEPDADTWGALLGACKIHGWVELAEQAMERLIRVDPDRDGAYVLMSNIYSSANRWKHAVRLRKEMKQNKVKKTPGGSSIQVNGLVYEFRKGERLDFPRSKEMYEMLHKITMNLKNDDQ